MTAPPRRHLLLAALAVASLVGSASAAQSVVALNGRNFHGAITKEQLWLVKFYAPWCGHCKRLAPVLDEVAKSFEEKEARFAKVDCTVDRGLCDEYFVKGFPVLKVLYDDHVWEYKGPRSKEGIMDLMDRMRRPSSKDLWKPEELHKMLDPPGTIVFFAGLNRPSQVEFPFFDVARDRKHVDNFGSSREGPVIKAAVGAEMRAWAQDTPWVARLEANEVPRFLPLTDKTTHKAIEAFVAQNRLPTMNLVGRNNFYDLSNAGRPLVMLVLDPATLATPAAKLTLTSAVTAEGTPGGSFLAFARMPKFQKRFVFAILDAAEHEEMVDSEYGIKRGAGPRMVVLRKVIGGDRAYAVDKEGDCTTSEGMGAFLTAVVDNGVFWHYEGMWGLPDRWWRIITKYAPFLSALDFLPRYLLTTVVIMLALRVLWAILTYGAVDVPAPSLPEKKKA